jgi:single-stranded-DNA-specific exonuclease
VAPAPRRDPDVGGSAMPSLIWDLRPCDEQAVVALAAALGITSIVARLLVLRGLANAGEAREFLSPSLDNLHDPWLLADMEPAVARLLAAIERGERIGIHGDYDVDGITATVILRRALELLGGEVVHFIPDRIRDGYGMRTPAIERLHADGVRLIVTVDCGIRGQEAARRARELGVDLIVTDHHEPEAELPVACAVLNPKRPDCAYPDKHLAGVGVALKLVQALCRRTGHDAWLPAFIKIAAIGTLADVVPVVGENRIIAKIGLELLSRGPHKVGLRALLEVAGLAGRPIDSHQVAFVLAPRMNAAGRMSTADVAMRLLLASDETMEAEARTLAQQLDGENLRRQREEHDIVVEARGLIEADPGIGTRPLIVVGKEGWHRGVIGIVASKVMEAFYRPVVILSIDGDVAHGSCRSIPAFDMLGALEHCRDVLLTFGGHKLAAGLTLEARRIDEFRAALCAHADGVLQPDDLRPRLRVDAGLTFHAIDARLLDDLRRLAPFGPGNPRPVFQAEDVEIVDGPRRIKDRHLKMTLRQRGRIFQAIAWRGIDREPFLLANRAGLRVAFSLEENTYNGEQYVNLSLADVKAAREEDSAGS